MALTLKDIKTKHDKAYIANQATREKAADDMVFYYVTQWDDTILSESQLAYRGEFNVLKKAGRDILSGLAANPVQIDFEPIEDTEDDDADIIDGMYRTDDRRNSTIEAYNQADQESVVCGMGAWELYTEYISNRSGDEKQEIRRRPIYEANNTAYPDPNAKRLDKSDAKYWSILRMYSEDGYKELVNDLTGEEIDKINLESFKTPEHSYTFPWIGSGGKHIYVVNFYHRELVKDKVLTMVDPFGQVKKLSESALEEVMDDMLDAGFEVESEKEVERWQVTKYIASGAEILNGENGEDGERVGEIIPGEYIPVVPEYGEYAYVEGELHYEGVTRLAKDPQRLRNFQMSYLADIVSRSPRRKPIFLQEQIAGFENMYSESGAENNFPYLLQNRKAGDGSDLPLGAIAEMPEQTIPQALIASIGLSREAVSDVANAAMTQDYSDVDLSGKALEALNGRIEKQAMVYQEHRKHSKRYDALVYSSIASEIYDTPREITLTKKDGTQDKVYLMEQVIDSETGDIVTLKDLTTSEFEVYSTIGPSYSSQREQTVDRLETMRMNLAPGDPMANALMLKQLILMDGVDFDDIRAYANKQLLISGIREPETDEDKQLLMQMQQQGQEPSADMVLAMAEMEKAKADQGKNQLELIKIQGTAVNEEQKRTIDAFKAETDRINTQIDAQEAGAKIDNTRSDTMSKELDNAAKVVELRQPQNMTNDELYQQIMAG